MSKMHIPISLREKRVYQSVLSRSKETNSTYHGLAHFAWPKPHQHVSVDAKQELNCKCDTNLSLSSEKRVTPHLPSTELHSTHVSASEGMPHGGILEQDH